MNTSVLNHNPFSDLLKEIKKTFKKVTYDLSREGRMIAKYNHLVLASKADYRSTPMLVVDGYAQNIEQAPKKSGGLWTLYGGQKVATDEVYRLVTSFDNKLACGYY